MEEQYLNKQERRKLAKEMKEHERSSGQMRKTAKRTIVAVFVAGLLFWAGFSLYRSLTAEKPGVSVPIHASILHVQEGASHDPYHSNPPTSGPHYVRTAKWGIHDKEIAPEFYVHNMEHGGVLIFYNCEKVTGSCDEPVNKLKELTQELRKKSKKVILAPNSKITKPIVATSWGWYEEYDAFDAPRIHAFFRAHIERGPEKTIE